MALFEMESTDLSHGLSVSEKSDAETLQWSEKFATMRQAVGVIRKGEVKYFVSRGTWSMYELLKYLLTQTGPAYVDAFTWNISMPAVTVLIDLKERGVIRSMRFLVHSAMKRYTAEAISVLQRHCDRLVLYPNHAKGFLIFNESWTVSVIASANFSNNVNVEAGAISCDPAVWHLHRQWLDPLFADEELRSSNRVEDRDAVTRHPPESGRILYLVRGFAAESRTAAARHLADAVFSDDDYFYDLSGIYRFEREKLPRAKAECFNSTRCAMEDRRDRIAVENVFAKERDLADYYALAASYGYRVVSLIAESGPANSAAAAAPSDRKRGKMDINL